MKVVITVNVKNPEAVKKALIVDVENNKNASVKIKTKGNLLTIEIKGEKTSHIKGIINSYLTLINVLNEME
ncbi:MAG: KEOPS complex subunit Pcc1 [Candidatus Aenigmarchaeota archaeon]|nr:KEOPS complex subunit Pcc1 [Candidatus Aenigmarchaeota archaeon]